jgi:Na+-translocating ferredoxin:NAD+ oxidoreductase RnfD subunit
MYGVVIAMIPAMLVSFYFFGLDAARVIFFSVAGCLLFEYLIQKFLMKQEPSINDGSALVTGVLLAFNVPAICPSGSFWWERLFPSASAKCRLVVWVRTRSTRRWLGVCSCLFPSRCK